MKRTSGSTMAGRTAHSVEPSQPSLHGLPDRERTVVLVLDLQNDFVSPTARMPIAASHRDEVIDAANALVSFASRRGLRIAYVRNAYPPNQRFRNAIRGHVAIAGSFGAEMDPRVRVVSDVIIDKATASAFANPRLEVWLRRARARAIVVAGVFAHACVCQTARGALSRGYGVALVREAIGGRSDASRDAALAGLSRRGAWVMTLAELESSLAGGDGTVLPSTGDD